MKNKALKKKIKNETSWSDRSYSQDGEYSLRFGTTAKYRHKGFPKRKCNRKFKTAYEQHDYEMEQRRKQRERESQ